MSIVHRLSLSCAAVLIFLCFAVSLYLYFLHYLFTSPNAGVIPIITPRP